MSMVFRFRMLSNENDYFIREYEVLYDMNLAAFNDFLCDDMRFDRNGITSFFTSNALWEKEREFTRLDMGAPGSGDDGQAPVPMEQVALGQVIRQNHDRLIFLFDVFGDRALYLELMEAKKRGEEIVYPRVTLAKADAPGQYLEDEGHGSFYDMMSDFDEFETYGENDFGDDF